MSSSRPCCRATDNTVRDFIEGGCETAKAGSRVHELELAYQLGAQLVPAHTRRRSAPKNGLLVRDVTLSIATGCQGRSDHESTAYVENRAQAAVIR